MNDTKLYEQILGLRVPWSVAAAALKKNESLLEVQATLCGHGLGLSGVRVSMSGNNADGGIWIAVSTKQFWLPTFRV
jgi:hypothetical protein